jgi:hypothetical protein
MAGEQSSRVVANFAKLKIAGTSVLSGQGTSISDVPAVTTVGSNSGTAGAGLSLIGDTTSVNQSAAIMNDLKALQEDLVALRTAVNSIISSLETQGLNQTV